MEELAKKFEEVFTRLLSEADQHPIRTIFLACLLYWLVRKIRRET